MTPIEQAPRTIQNAWVAYFAARAAAAGGLVDKARLLEQEAEEWVMANRMSFKLIDGGKDAEGILSD